MMRFLFQPIKLSIKLLMIFGVVVSMGLSSVEEGKASETLSGGQKEAIVSRTADKLIYATVNRKTGKEIRLTINNDNDNKLRLICIDNTCINLPDKFPSLLKFGNISLEEVKIYPIYQAGDDVQVSIEITSRNKRARKKLCPNIPNYGIADIRVSMSISNKYGVLYFYASCNNLSVISYSNFLIISSM